MWKFLDKRLGIKATKVHKDKYGKVYAKEYTIPKSYVRLPLPPRKLSAAHKKRLAENLKSARANKGGGKQ